MKPETTKHKMHSKSQSESDDQFTAYTILSEPLQYNSCFTLPNDKKRPSFVI